MKTAAKTLTAFTLAALAVSALTLGITPKANAGGPAVTTASYSQVSFGFPTVQYATMYRNLGTTNWVPFQALLFNQDATKNGNKMLPVPVTGYAMAMNVDGVAVPTKPDMSNIDYPHYVGSIDIGHLANGTHLATMVAYFWSSSTDSKGAVHYTQEMRTEKMAFVLASPK